MLNFHSGLLKQSLQIMALRTCFESKLVKNSFRRTSGDLATSYNEIPVQIFEDIQETFMSLLITLRSNINLLVLRFQLKLPFYNHMERNALSEKRNITKYFFYNSECSFQLPSTEPVAIYRLHFPYWYFRTESFVLGCRYFIVKNQKFVKKKKRYNFSTKLKAT